MDNSSHILQQSSFLKPWLEIENLTRAILDESRRGNLSRIPNTTEMKKYVQPVKLFSRMFSELDEEICSKSLSSLFTFPYDTLHESTTRICDYYSTMKSSSSSFQIVLAHLLQIVLVYANATLLHLLRDLESKKTQDIDTISLVVRHIFSLFTDSLFLALGNVATYDREYNIFVRMEDAISLSGFLIYRITLTFRADSLEAKRRDNVDSLSIYQQGFKSLQILSIVIRRQYLMTSSRDVLPRDGSNTANSYDALSLKPGSTDERLYDSSLVSYWIESFSDIMNSMFFRRCYDDTTNLDEEIIDVSTPLASSTLSISDNIGTSHDTRAERDFIYTSRPFASKYTPPADHLDWSLLVALDHFPSSFYVLLMISVNLLYRLSDSVPTESTRDAIFHKNMGLFLSTECNLLNGLLQTLLDVVADDESRRESVADSENTDDLDEISSCCDLSLHFSTVLLVSLSHICQTKNENEQSVVDISSSHSISSFSFPSLQEFLLHRDEKVLLKTQNLAKEFLISHSSTVAPLFSPAIMATLGSSESPFDKLISIVQDDVVAKLSSKVVMSKFAKSTSSKLPSSSLPHFASVEIMQKSFMSGLDWLQRCESHYQEQYFPSVSTNNAILLYSSILSAYFSAAIKSISEISHRQSTWKGYFPEPSILIDDTPISSHCIFHSAHWMWCNVLSHSIFHVMLPMFAIVCRVSTRALASRTFSHNNVPRKNIVVHCQNNEAAHPNEPLSYSVLLSPDVSSSTFEHAVNDHKQRPMFNIAYHDESSLQLLSLGEIQVRITSSSSHTVTVRSCVDNIVGIMSESLALLSPFARLTDLITTSLAASVVDSSLRAIYLAKNSNSIATEPSLVKAVAEIMITDKELPLSILHSLSALVSAFRLDRIITEKIAEESDLLARFGDDKKISSSRRSGFLGSFPSISFDSLDLTSIVADSLDKSRVVPSLLLVLSLYDAVSGLLCINKDLLSVNQEDVNIFNIHEEILPILALRTLFQHPATEAVRVLNTLSRNPSFFHLVYLSMLRDPLVLDGFTSSSQHLPSVQAVLSCSTSYFPPVLVSDKVGKDYAFQRESERSQLSLDSLLRGLSWLSVRLVSHSVETDYSKIGRLGVSRDARVLAMYGPEEDEDDDDDDEKNNFEKEPFELTRVLGELTTFYVRSKAQTTDFSIHEEEDDDVSLCVSGFNLDVFLSYCLCLQSVTRVIHHPRELLQILGFTLASKQQIAPAIESGKLQTHVLSVSNLWLPLVTSSELWLKLYLDQASDFIGWHVSSLSPVTYIRPSTSTEVGTSSHDLEEIKAVISLLPSQRSYAAVTDAFQLIASVLCEALQTSSSDLISTSLELLQSDSIVIRSLTDNKLPPLKLSPMSFIIQSLSLLWVPFSSQIRHRLYREHNKSFSSSQISTFSSATNVNDVIYIVFQSTFSNLELSVESQNRSSSTQMPDVSAVAFVTSPVSPSATPSEEFTDKLVMLTLRALRPLFYSLYCQIKELPSRNTKLHSPLSIVTAGLLAIRLLSSSSFVTSLFALASPLSFSVMKQFEASRLFAMLCVVSTHVFLDFTEEERVEHDVVYFAETLRRLHQVTVPHLSVETAVKLKKLAQHEAELQDSENMSPVTAYSTSKNEHLSEIISEIEQSPLISLEQALTGILTTKENWTEGKDEAKYALESILAIVEKV